MLQQLFTSVRYVGALCSAFAYHMLTASLQKIYKIMGKNIHFYYVNGEFLCIIITIRTLQRCGGAATAIF